MDGPGPGSLTPAIIRRARRRRGWSQQALAAWVGVDRRTVIRWETGLSRPRRHRSLRLLALVLFGPEMSRDVQPLP